MTPLQWTLLCGFFTIYLLFGGTIFMVLEQHNEILNKEQLSILRQDVQEILLRLDRDFYHNATSMEVLDALRAAKEGVINRISDVCGGINLLDRSQEDRLKWNYYNSVFFAFTIVTTIGYGHLAPGTDWSRVFVIFYALVGIPINGILLQGLGDYFSSKLVKAHKKSKEKRYENKLTLVFDIIFYLIPGLVIFIVLPAGIFTLIENWNYMDSIYYSFVTLTTIGFGDFVAGMGDGHNIWLWFYKAFIIIWILFGLGYLMMILGFITKGLTHKKVRIVIENRLNTIRSTKEKLSKDVEYMRRVINELYMMKIKPVFPENEDAETDQYYVQKQNRNKDRTQSHPCLRDLESQRNGCHNKMSSLPNTPNACRRRGSVLPDGTIGRTLSETDLYLIDKNKTFEDAMSHCVLPDELLAAVVDVWSHNVVKDVLDAVDELNEFEEIESVVASSKNSPHTLKKKLDQDYPSSIVGWPNLAKLNESDEEVLITGLDGELSDDSFTETLEEVVIHVDHDPNKPPSQKLIDKVNTAIRKISTGNKSPSEVPSRKVSRNESARKKKPFGSAPPSRKTSQNDPPDHLMCNGTNDSHSDSSSHEPHALHSGRSSVTRSPRLERSSEHRRSGYHNHNHHHPHPHSRKISEESSSGSRPITVETTSLADFLRALDTVHHKLKHVDNGNKHNANGESQDDMRDGSSPYSHGSKGDDSENRDRRQRKVGIFNPGFSYVNHAFDPSPELPSQEEGSIAIPLSTNTNAKNETTA